MTNKIIQALIILDLNLFSLCAGLLFIYLKIGKTEFKRISDTLKII